MRLRSILITAAATIVLSAGVAASAQAKATNELLDRRVFDGTPERTASTLHLDGPTAGPLGGALEVIITAKDGTLPATFGSCEKVRVTAVLTVSPGEILVVAAKGEACAHIVDGTLQVNAFFDKHDVTYSGTAHKKAKLIGDGLIAAAHQQFGGLANFSGEIAWK